MGGAAQLNSRRVHRPAVFAGYRYGNGAVYPVVCDDPMRGKQDLADLAPKDGFIPAEKAHMRHVARQACGSRLGLDMGFLLGDVIGRLACLRPETHFIGSAVAKSARGFLQTSSNGV
jgi:hypothetical protein